MFIDSATTVSQLNKNELQHKYDNQGYVGYVYYIFMEDITIL